MKKERKRNIKKMTAFCLAGIAVFTLISCTGKEDPNNNLIKSKEENKRIVNLFSPMEKTEPDVENVARSAADKTIMLAEEKLGVKVAYRTYTAEDYQDRTYDEVALDRARNNMDDIYLLNPDTVLILGEEGKLKDLSGLDSAKNLREIIRTANTAYSFHTN